MRAGALGLGLMLGAVLVLGQRPLDSADPATAVSRVAKGITVLIDGVNPGSGVLLSREGNTYTVLTAAHVVPVQDEYDVVTPDGQRHPLKYDTVQKLAGVDLATAKFTTDRTYPVAMVGMPVNLSRVVRCMWRGFPSGGRQLLSRFITSRWGALQPMPAVRWPMGMVWCTATPRCRG